MEGPAHERRRDEAENQPNGSQDNLIEQLRRGLENTRLPADLKAQILAQDPPVEECERLYKELQEKGGLTFAEFLASLGLEVQSQP
jgi:hypothetical protein